MAILCCFLLQKNVLGFKKELEKDKVVTKIHKESNPSIEVDEDSSSKGEINTSNSAEATHTQSNVSKVSQCTFNKNP